MRECVVQITVKLICIFNLTRNCHQSNKSGYKVRLGVVRTDFRLALTHLTYMSIENTK